MGSQFLLETACCGRRRPQLALFRRPAMARAAQRPHAARFEGAQRPLTQPQGRYPDFHFGQRGWRGFGAVVPSLREHDGCCVQHRCPKRILILLFFFFSLWIRIPLVPLPRSPSPPLFFFERFRYGIGKQDKSSMCLATRTHLPLAWPPWSSWTSTRGGSCWSAATMASLGYL